MEEQNQIQKNDGKERGGVSSISWFICCRAARALARRTRQGKEEYITSIGSLAQSNSSINRLLLGIQCQQPIWNKLEGGGSWGDIIKDNQLGSGGGYKVKKIISRRLVGILLGLLREGHYLETGSPEYRDRKDIWLYGFYKKKLWKSSGPRNLKVW